MAPIKYENDFKEKLEKRTIAPSKGAWDKLSSRLSAEERTSSNKGLWWLGIAASVVGILLVVSQWLNSGKDINNKQIVDTKNTIENPEKNSASKAGSTLESVTAVAEETTNKNDINNAGESNLVIDKANLNSTSKSVQLATEQTTQKIREEKDVTQPKRIEITTFETEKAQEVADAIYALSETESGVSNASIDSLLKAAQKDILLSRMKNEDKTLVDAALLLQEVEFELDQSFRDKVFKALKDSYGSVKTAIAQRND
ncbi:hypothetical protein [Jejuia pallidilutea]|uniref:Uncharacterized protein n=1 Tax=Jejuia pallidilutea TaxID=504487 RepID=A0A090VXL5_9FLAO|nr:hypothetical protein [Jejuia pallidilutea]GAL68723.1 hypothetical protein JCM19301_1093 [Jejuia pallidilutea]GAL90308.1 hypothetical protein JCM19538_73 [Jejuia pallidilutea]